LQLLQQGLLDSFDVFHGVVMPSVYHGEQKFGELYVLLEIKSGQVTITNNSITKSYAGKHKDVLKQGHLQRTATISRLQCAGLCRRP
jgi:hypothetical protein